MAEKLSHKAVEYGPGDKDSDHCAVCAHYIAAGPHCRIVSDPIKSLGWCKKFKDKPVKGAARQAMNRGLISRSAYAKNN